MSKSRRRPPLLMFAAVGFTAFVWIGRIRNVVRDDEMSSAAKFGVVALSASFLVLAAIVVWAWIVRSEVLAPLVALTAGWTTAVWVVRVFDIVFLDDHDLPFIVVHSLLGVVSVVLWVLTWRQVGGRDPSAQGAQNLSR